jgi:tRNA G18 (ribose-2'-O)-methylase SpoU
MELNPKSILLFDTGELVRIPMAAGQSSLNVGVAAGILLYSLTRQKMTLS